MQINPYVNFNGNCREAVDRFDIPWMINCT